MWRVLPTLTFGEMVASLTVFMFAWNLLLPARQCSLDKSAVIKERLICFKFLMMIISGRDSLFASPLYSFN